MCRNNPDNAQSEKALQRKAKSYAYRKYALGIANLLFTFLLIFLFQFSGASKFFAESIKRIFSNYYFVIALYIFIAYTIYAIFLFPINFYSNFLLEHQFGLSRQNLKDWWIDFAKTFLISFLILLFIFEAFYFILQRFPVFWWLVLWGFWLFFSLVLAKLIPVCVIPLFFKYQSLKDDAFKERILHLARKMQVGVLDVYQIDFSKKTNKANAAFVGIGKTKRLILADTLKDAYSQEEIEVILAHEMAHYKLRHLLKLIFVNSFFMLILIYLLYKTQRYILELANLGSFSDVANLPVIMLYAIIFNVAAQPISYALSRKFEKEADSLSIKFTGFKAEFISLMQKLAKQNLAFSRPPKWIKIFFFDHPPIDERIEIAQKYAG